MKNILKLLLVSVLFIATSTVAAQNTMDLAVYKTLDANEGTAVFLTEADVTLAGINTSVGYKFVLGQDVSAKEISLGLGKSINVGTLTLTPSLYGAATLNVGGDDYTYGLDGEVDVTIFSWLAASGKYQWTQNSNQPFAIDNFGATYLVGAKIRL